MFGQSWPKKLMPVSKTNSSPLAVPSASNVPVIDFWSLKIDFQALWNLILVLFYRLNDTRVHQ